MKLKGSGGLARIQIKTILMNCFCLSFLIIIISLTFYFLTNSDHFHDWHCVISGILSFIFPCILSQEFPRSLHFYSTNTGRKWGQKTHFSQFYHLQTSYFISRQWLNSLFRCQKNPSRGVPASLLTHAWLLWRSSSPHSDPACRRGTSHPRKTFWRWCWWLPSWWVWTWCRVGRHASWGW